MFSNDLATDKSNASASYKMFVCNRVPTADAFKTLLQKEKLLIMIKFSFCKNVFNSIIKLSFKESVHVTSVVATHRSFKNNM